MQTVDFESLAKELQQPEGCVGITEVRANGEPRRLLQTVIGRHVYSLEYAPDEVQLIHATPGAGTWVATLPVADLPNRDSLRLVIAWSPEELRLSAVDPEDSTKGRIAHGERTGERLQVGADGASTFVGSNTFGVRVRIDGHEVSSPSAIELWEATLEAVRVLLTGTSDEGFLHEVVTCNAALGMLVTGLETYSQGRFVEIEGEGVPVDALKFLKRFGSAEERAEMRAGRSPEAAGLTPGESLDRAAVLVGRVNFQNFDALKRAFAKGYGLRLGVDLSISSQLLERVQTLLGYRHRIVHENPMLAIFNNIPGVLDTDWEWSSKTFGGVTAQEMNEFVVALHAGTLTLRPSRPNGAMA